MVLTAETYWRNISGGGAVTQAIVRDPWPGNGGKRLLSAQEWFGTQLLIRIRVSDRPISEEAFAKIANLTDHHKERIV